MIKLNNRYNDIFTFTLDEDNSILWEGAFNWCSFNTNEEGSTSSIDPSGGPYIGQGMHMGDFGGEFKGKFVKEFRRIETGYKIILE